VLASLTALGALSVCNVLRQSYALPAQIKWPNDVLVARRKVAGVLAEAVWAGNACAAVILGVGLNVAPASIAEESLPASAVSFPVTCVENELGKPLSRFEVLRLVLQELLNWLPRLPSSTFLQAWERALAFKGEPVHVITPGIRLAGQQSPASKIYEGELLGLAGDGSLRLKLSSGEVVSLISGDLHHRPRI